MSRADNVVHSVAVVEAAPGPTVAGRQRRLAGTLAELGYEVTLVSRRSDGAHRSVNQSRGVTRVLEVPRLQSEIRPGFAAVSYELYRALRGATFDAIVFDELGGHAYCTARARQLGLDFHGTSIVVVCSGGELYTAVRDNRVYLPRHAFATGVLERLALSLADVAVFDDLAELEWTRSVGWSLPARCVELGQGAADRDLWSEVLVGGDAMGKRSGPRALPDVSVVVPRHERTTYLPHCLEALAAQSLLPLT